MSKSSKPQMTPALETILRTALSYSPALQLVVRERVRQITEEGWLPEHDDAHIKGELAQGAACYADASSMQSRGVNVVACKSVYFEGAIGTPFWPFDQDSFRPKDDPLRNAVIAAALALADADRIIRGRLGDKALEPKPEPVLCPNLGF